MKQCLILVALTLPIWIADRLGAPKWGLMLASLPFFLMAASMGDPDETMFGEASETIGGWLLVLVGMGCALAGWIGWSLRATSSLFGLLGWMLPVGLVVIALGAIRIFRG